MNDPAISAAASSDLDPELVELVEDLSRRAQDGTPIDMDAILAEHPEHADRLRALLPAMCGLAELFRSGVDEPSGGLSFELAGGTLLGDYRIIRRIGQGGMGVVYEAIQTSLGRRVALKVLPQSWSTPSLRRRFEREAQAAASLHHTNIVPVFGVAEHQGMLVYAMQFIAGKSLDRLIAERLRGRAGSLPPADPSRVTTEIGPLPPGPHGPGSTETDAKGLASTHASGASIALHTASGGAYYRDVARAGIQAAEALDFAHRQGILHRDVKPANLLLDDHGVLWLTDFGLAQVEGAADLTRTGTLVGTLRYIAPERLTGTSDARSDIYGLGTTLYELAILEPAFPETDRVRLLRQIENEAPRAPRAVAPDVPRDLETILQKAMDRDPGRRYRSAGDLAEDLRRFVEDRPILARPLRLHERLWRWCRRKPLLASLTGAVVAATLVSLTTLAVAVVLISGALGETEKVRGDAETERGRAELRAEENARLAIREKELRQTEETLRRKIERDAAGLLLEKAYAQCEQENAAIGSLWLARAIKAAEDAGETELAASARLYFNAWSRHLHRLTAITPMGPFDYVLAFGPHGSAVVTASGKARLWDTLLGEEIGPPLPAESELRCAAFDPSGKVLALGYKDGAVRLWDVDARAQRGPTQRHLESVPFVRFTPDGKVAITAGINGEVRQWSAATGEPAGPPLSTGPLADLVVLPDGETLLTLHRGRNSVRFWRRDTGKSNEELLTPIQAPSHVAVSPDGTQLLLGNFAGETLAIDLRTKRPRGPLWRQTGQVLRIDFHPGGRHALIATRDGTVQVWDVHAQERFGPPLRHPAVSTAAFLGTGQVISFGVNPDRSVRIWELELGRPASPPLLHEQMVTSARYDPTGRRIVTTSGDNTARLWDTKTGQPAVPPLEHPGHVYTAAFTSDGQRVLTGSTEARAYLWDTTTGKSLGSLNTSSQQHVTALGFTPDDKTVLVEAGNRLMRFDRITRRPIGQPMAYSVNGSFSFDPSGTRILTSALNYARMLDVATFRTEGPQFSVPGKIGAMTLARGGNGVALGAQDGTLWMWNTRTGQVDWHRHRHVSSILCLAASPDGSIVLSAGGEGAAYLWEAATGRLLGPPLRGARGGLLAAAFAPDGSTFATGGADKTARLWFAPHREEGDARDLALRAAADTGLDLDERGSIRVLDAAAWRTLRQKLDPASSKAPP